jgi:hypothetical protein
MHITRTHTLYFKADIDTVFPLFTPLEEKKWVQGWDATLIFSHTDAARETGCIFSTPHMGLPETIWVLSRYDDVNRVIQYVRFAAGHHVALIDINAEEQTRVQVTYTLTGLSDQGDHYLQHEFSEAKYLARMQSWQQGISAYLGRLTTSH